MPTNMPPIAQPMAPMSRASIAMAMYEPTPGSLMFWLETEIACEVKIAKMGGHLTPNRLPGNRAMKPATVMDRKPRIGIDCRMSSKGTMTRSATRYLAATAAKAQAKTMEAAKARNMR